MVGNASSMCQIFFNEIYDDLVLDQCGVGKTDGCGIGFSVGKAWRDCENAVIFRYFLLG